MESLLIQAVAYTELGEPMAALQAWTKACIIADQTGLLRPFTTITSTHIAQLHTTASGDSKTVAQFLNTHAPEAFPATVPIVTLTAREQEVLKLLGHGLRLSEMAETLYVSINTIKTQLRTLYKKLDAHNRDEALTRAHEFQFL
ncbi:response regulator transcription factor [Rhodococcus erythropolis]|uniref:Response regulator transcription factor n=1 Tax=Rhodococcus erythropolis TaxID=1833 RepID=A0A8I0ZR61_RHOER|nr:LuxR C-terminal-related transcriptional regulator [Rhodococcus erythropolis]MBH5144319.1 response regulator transcription factor [Rhodococcus erythropolis]